MIANPERGEVEVLLDGKPYPLRPSYEAVKAIELDLGTTLQVLTARAKTSVVGLQLTEYEAILYHGIVAAGKERGDKMLQAVNKDKLGTLAFEAGVTNLLEPVGTFLINALNGGKPVVSTKKNGKATTRTIATGE